MKKFIGRLRSIRTEKKIVPAVSSMARRLYSFYQYRPPGGKLHICLDRKFLTCANVLHGTSSLVISLCWFVNDGIDIYQNENARARRAERAEIIVFARSP